MPSGLAHPRDDGGVQLAAARWMLKGRAARARPGSMANRAVTTCSRKRGSWNGLCCAGSMNCCDP